MSNYKVENIQHVYFNGKQTTLAKVFKEEGGAWVFDGNVIIGGHYKRESTIIKKYLEQE